MAVVVFQGNSYVQGACRGEQVGADNLEVDIRRQGRLNPDPNPHSVSIDVLCADST